MSDEKEDPTIVEEESNQKILEETDEVKLSFKESLKEFLRKSGISLVLGGIAIIIIILLLFS